MSFRQLEESEPNNFIRHQDGATSLWHLSDCVYFPLLPDDLLDLRHRIEADVARISSDKLKRVWDELAYRLDVCLVTNGAHIAHL
ncbi:hypothetical protein TNCV_4615721 [Trichonephila clavipes]|nr:hypothetical protein TNCV_4615721 [Trichonephila clavipes]